MPPAIVADALRAALAAADPAACVARALRWQVCGRALACDGGAELPVGGACVVLGAGKASLPMAAAAVQLLRARPPSGGPPPTVRGLVVARDGGVGGGGVGDAAAASELRAAGLEVVWAAHPVPDGRGAAAAAALSALAAGADGGAGESVLLLLSGGGSALLPAPAPGLTLGDLVGLNAALLDSGCTIAEANALRKHTSALAGGRLARAVSAPLLTLALSDVIGDRPDVIASGPTALPDGSTWADCAAALARYPGLAAALPPRVAALVTAADAAGETPKQPAPPGQALRVVGSNASALRAAAARLRDPPHALPALLLTAALQGEAAEVARALVAAARDARAWEWAGAPLVAPSACGGGGRPVAALLAGGETTVTLRVHAGARAPGRGGRNQELALAALIAFAEAEAGSPAAAAAPHTAGDLAIICFATDGSDGPTDAAGACIPSAREHWRARAAAGIDAAGALRRHDAYEYFASMDAVMAAATARAGAHASGDDEQLPLIACAPGGLIRTGATGTNVGDIVLFLVY
jgi:glycerate 2-kinase